MEKIKFDKLGKLDYGVTEALRTLKTNIQFCGDDIKTILLTSSIPSEGKVQLHLIWQDQWQHLERKLFM